jgi:DNA-binding GntR family transcriptional regulator
MSKMFERAVPRTLRDEVVDMIRDAIVSGKLRPGERLKENDIAADMSVSRSPVREAFRQLEQEGLVESIPNQGTFVSVLQPDDVREIFTLRATLEDLACVTVVEQHKLGPADFEQLEAYIEQQRAAVKVQDFDRLTKLDTEFHEFICHKSGFDRLLKMWRSLRGQIQVLLYQRFHRFEWVPETVDTDHTALSAALRQGDVQRCFEINREVNTRVAEECVKVLQAMLGEASR